MIGHHHAVEADLFIYSHRLEHIDIAVIDERFLEVQKTSTDVSEMDIEDLAGAAKVADHIKDFSPGILEHFSHGALAEVQSVVSAFFDGNESLETIN